MRRPLPAALMFLLLFTPPAAAQDPGNEPLVTDRPDFTESALTVPEGRVQLEFGYTFNRSGPEKLHDLGEILARIGYREDLEIRIGINSYSWTDRSGRDLAGLEDLSVGFKIRLLENNGGAGFKTPDAALLAGTTLPTGSEDFGEDEWQPGFTLALGWTFSEKVSLGSNAGYTHAASGGAHYNQFSGSVSLGYSMSDRLGSFIEAFAFFPAENNGPNTRFLNGGLTYLLSSDFQLDVRAGIGMNDADPEYFFGAGAAYRI